MFFKFFSVFDRRDAEINELNIVVEDNNTLIAQLQKRIKELEVGVANKWIFDSMQPLDIVSTFSRLK